MSDKIKTERFFLNFLLNANENQQKCLIQHITKSQLNVIIEIIYNAIAGNLTISNNDKKSFTKVQNGY
jgi:hypothetical protein